MTQSGHCCRLLVLWVTVTCLVQHSDPVLGAAINEQFEVMLDWFWTWQKSLTVADFTEQTFVQSKEQAQSLLEMFRQVDADELEPQQQISREIVLDSLKTIIENYKWRKYSAYNALVTNPYPRWKAHLLQSGGQTVEQTRLLLAVYRHVVTVLYSMLALMRRAIEAKTTLAAVSIQPIIDELDEELSVPANETDYMKQFVDLPSDWSHEERSNISREGREVVTQLYLPAWLKVRDFLKYEYLPHTRAQPGVFSLPDGTSYYQALLQYHLSVNLTASQVHDIGLLEVERIHAQLTTEAEKVGFNGTIKEFNDYLKDIPENFYQTEDELLQGLKDTIKVIESKLHLVIRTTSSRGLLVEKSQFVNSPSGYRKPSFDGTRPGTFYANVFHPQEKPKFNQVALALHEAKPGHHTQFTHLQDEASIAMFRRRRVWVPMFLVPFDFPKYTSYIEGWALYAESLGEEMGLYDQPYTRVGRLNYELFRAARLVVDTGLHAFGWSQHRAIEYMANLTNLPMVTLEVEVVRYISWPGQACAYKIGELKIQEMRKLAETELGDKFDIRDFHEEILSLGPVPLRLLEHHLRGWITKTAYYQSASPDSRGNVYLLATLLSITTIQL